MWRYAFRIPDRGTLLGVLQGQQRRRSGMLWGTAIAALLGLPAAASSGCGGGETATVVATAPVASPVRDAPIADGQRVLERAGCLACHQLGKRGNSGPGNSLAGIGARRSAAEIRRSLLDAPAPMPSYGDLPREQLDDLVAYLAALRGPTPCPYDADCG